MSEHTDSARLEATRDAIRTGTAPRPRVEGEAWAPRMPSSVVQDEINYCTHKLDRTFRDEVDLRAYLYICQDWRDFQSRLARLTAEVERLRGDGKRLDWLGASPVLLVPPRMGAIVWMDGSADAPKPHDIRASIDAAMQRNAALALPTPGAATDAR